MSVYGLLTLSRCSSYWGTNRKILLCMCTRKAYVSCAFTCLNTSNACWLIYNGKAWLFVLIVCHHFLGLWDLVLSSMTFPCAIPPLPASAMLWPANLLIAYDTLSDIYQHALQAWRQEDHDPLHLEFHLGLLQGNTMHLLEAIEVGPSGSDLVQWLTRVTKLIGQLYIAVACYCNNIHNR